MTTRSERRRTAREWLLFVTLSPLLLAALLLVLVGLPFYWLYRFLLRLVVESLWVTRGKRVLLVYSRSPVWQEYIETTWFPRLQPRAIVLNWSDRKNWRRVSPFAALVFRHWASGANFNPMVLVFTRFPRTRRIGFYYAFRDWKHGDDRALREAESQLFTLVEGLWKPRSA